MGLEARLRERIHREGPISFADFHEAALYDAEDGFFTRGGGAGRAGRDFVTSPEVGSLFGMVVARALDDAWHRLGEPDPFVVVEAGAGRGRLGADVVRAQPDCVTALRYVLVERSPQLRDEQRERLALEPPDEALGPFLVAEDGEAPEPQPGQGPIVTALDELPGVRVTGVVLANELLDNLPVHVVERAEDGWLEVRVDADADRFVEVLVPAAPPLAAEADVVAEGAVVPVGARLPVPVAARTWLERVGGLLRRGEVVLFDYVDTASSLAARGQGSWMRTYRAHQRGADPLDSPGAQDITCDVPLEYLRRITERVGMPIAEYLPQREWMGRHGIVELVAEGDRLWQEGAARGDLAAIAGRSRGVEAAALTDPGGLGAHRVLVLRREGAG
ncbi:MAG: SAM-dependent methyltransferase [Acidimicrobiia bacterium]|jgi:SAM-dependent MidA family methyltransferase